MQPQNKLLELVLNIQTPSENQRFMLQSESYGDCVSQKYGLYIKISLKSIVQMTLH